MPLSQGKSKKSFEKNLKTELGAGKPKAQSLAIAYNIQRKNKVKKAQGGLISAKDEIEATEDNQDKAHIDMEPSKASGSEDEIRAIYGELPEEDAEAADWDESIADTIRRRQSEKEMYAEGGSVAGVEDDEEPTVPGRKPDDMRRAKEEYMADHFSEGGEVGSDKPSKLFEDPDFVEADDKNSKDEDSSYSITGGPAKVKVMKAYGGEIEDDEFESTTPHEAIMKRRARLAEMDDGESDGMVDLEKNSEEDLNNEDQMSFKAGLKEQYDDSQISAGPSDSNEEGDQREEDAENEDDTDLVSRIRRSMKKSVR
jgi:hypothetical protein